MRFALVILLLLSAVNAASLLVPAVSTSGRGIAVNLTCEVTSGRGRVLVSTEPLVGLDTQSSEKLAVNYVSKELGVDLSNKDVLFIFGINSTAQIDGSSAGAAMTICLLSELTGKPINQGVGITGTIENEGFVGKVGGILPKLRALSDSISVMLIPKGQSSFVSFVKKYSSTKPGIYIEEIQPVKVNVSEYAKSLGVKVIEIGSIADAERWFFSSEDLTKHQQTFELPDFPDSLPRARAIANFELRRAEHIDNSTSVQELVTRALNVPESYYYTRANFAFLAYLSSNPNYEDVTSLAEELQKRFSQTGDPYWHSEAELRLSWVLLKDEFTPAKEEWLMIAAKMLSLENSTDKVLKISEVKDLANKKIVEAKDELEKAKLLGADTSNAEESLNLAIQSFEKGMYYASLYNALDSRAWSLAEQTSKKALFEILMNSTAFNDEFSESYRRHAFYLFKEGNYEVSAYSFYRAQLRNGVFEGIPLIEQKHFFFDWKMFTIILLLSYLLYTKKTPSVKLKKELSQTDLMHLAEAKGAAIKVIQDKLKAGEISPEEYKKLIDELGE